MVKVKLLIINTLTLQIIKAVSFQQTQIKYKTFLCSIVNLINSNVDLLALCK